MQPITYLVGVTQPDYSSILEYLTGTGQKSSSTSLRRRMANTALSAFVQCLPRCATSLWYLGRMQTSARSAISKPTLQTVTSGKYVSVEDTELVLPPEMNEHTVVNSDVDTMTFADAYDYELARMKTLIANCRKVLDLDNKPLPLKKWWTSQLRRGMPNGQNNEIAWIFNIRSLRHMIEMRTSRHAEWEIRLVFNQVVDLVTERWPLMLYGGTSTAIDGFYEYTGLKV